MDSTDIAVGTDSLTSSTSWTVPIPTVAPSGLAVDAGDLKYIFMAADDVFISAVTPAGWTRIGNVPILNGRWYIYFRIHVAGDGDPTVTFTPSTSGTAVIMVIPGDGISTLVGANISNIATTPDPNPINFLDCIGGLRVLSVVATGDLEQDNSNRWELLAKEVTTYGVALWAHVAFGPVDRFDLSTPGASDPYQTFNGDFRFAQSFWGVGKARMGGGAWT